ncbi:hypothetical protein AVEN_68494-1 [Araneus ventricosus]|uniref:Uncharacterized protein n=1 Tax=Araneus ventricosus TaxID=182803 RepID=A0A4Y2I5M9_ARAVE|nr:hypothetical protein AVEN_68494-1 [Araneus ventricosus]
MGAVMRARLTKYVLQTINCSISQTFHWTDSTIVLHWIKGDPNRWKPFVCNQVIEIQDKTESSTWNYCPGEENPAGLLTRGERSVKLRESKVWLHGPDWLPGDRRDWPVEYPEFEIKESSEERKGGRKGKILHTS